MPIPKIEARSSTMSQRLGFHDPDLTSPEHDAMVFWVKNHLKKEHVSTLNKLKELPLEATRHNNELIYALDKHLNEIESKITFGLGWSEERKQEKINDRKAELLRLIERLKEYEWEERIKQLTSNCLKIKLECPIQAKNGFIIGYVDIRASHSNIHLLKNTDYDRPEFPEFPFYCGIMKGGIKQVNIEVKPKIQSFGELVRQINTYRTYPQLEDGHYPDSIKWYVACPDDRHKDNLADENIGFIHITEDYKEYL